MIRASALNTLRYEPELCINCGMCSAVCPHGVFAPDGRVARLARPEACMECGACQMNCPTGAIAVESGVGCAYAMIRAALSGKRGVPSSCCGGGPEASCTCESESEPACCGERSPAR
jgi:NAD-dependent dihydropyrimidine dehydrogenase PreA subunit